MNTWTFQPKAISVLGVSTDSTSSVKDVDLVPMINVVFLLLIFFMLAGVFRTTPQSPNLQLPASAVSATVSETPNDAVVSIDSSGNLFISNELVSPVAFETALTELRKSSNSEHLIVRADANAPASKVITLFTLAGDAGFQQAGLETLVGSKSQ